MDLVLAFFTAVSFIKIAVASDFVALLVAGSRGIYNYRHQADVCHTYSLLIDGGIEANQIKVMMYDDVAWSEANPLMGRLFNEPNGINVYDSCRIDYRKEEVNINTFTNALTTLPSHAQLSNEATVFLSFVDHGEPGRLLFPSADEGLSGSQLLAAINAMNFRRMVIYVEACFGGSVFEDINLPQNVIAVTASNATESSWGTFCPSPQHPDADAINGIHIGTCLGDLFEVAWKRDLEARLAGGLLNESTLSDHVLAVREIVSKKSNVMVYGDMGLLEEKLIDLFPLKTSSNHSPHVVAVDLLVESSLEQKRIPSATLPFARDNTLVAT